MDYQDRRQRPAPYFFLTFTYNENKHIIKTEDNYVKFVEYVYDDFGNLVEFTNSKGIKTKYAYWEWGVKDTDGVTIANIFSSHNIKSITYPNSASVIIQYDNASDSDIIFDAAKQDKVSRIKFPSQKETLFTYKYIKDNQAKVSSNYLTEGYDAYWLDYFYEYTPEYGITTDVNYEMRNEIAVSRLTRSLTRGGADYPDIEGAGEVSRVTLDANNNVNKIYDTRTEYPDTATTIDSDTRHNPVHITSKDGDETNFEYDGEGRLTSQTDARGNQTQYVYDETSWNLTSVIDANGNETVFYYNSKGDMKRKQDSDGFEYYYKYDNFGNMVLLARIGLLEGNTVTLVVNYDYDDYGNRIKTTDTKGNITEYIYDKLNRLIAVKNNNLGQVYYTYYAYDDMGNRISVTDANNNITYYDYNISGRLVKVRMPEGTEKSYEYNYFGNLINFTDPNGMKTKYIYKHYDRMRVMEKRYYYLEGGEYTLDYKVFYNYDEEGNRIKMEDPKVIKETTFDVESRIKDIKTNYYPGSEDAKLAVVSYEYDEVGNRISMIQPHLFDEDVPDPVTYNYDKLNRLTEINYPEIGIVTYDYFDCCNLRKKITYPNNSYVDYAYDDFKNLKTLTNYDKNSTMISSYSYYYDKNGNRMGMIENIKNPDSTLYIERTKYNYDDLNQLTRVRYYDPDSTFPYQIIIEHSYNYDPVGNRKEESVTESIGKMTILLYRKYYSYDAENRLLTLNHAVPGSGGLGKKWWNDYA
ncbi:RHS repeat protein, partial [Candidatus Dependentiae bacterium]|nr:RHS repeat protein [Candidatus Dependentiae bacterium]